MKNVILNSQLKDQRVICTTPLSTVKVSQTEGHPSEQWLIESRPGNSARRVDIAEAQRVIDALKEEGRWKIRYYIAK